jgi:hypothetical protein
MSEFETLTSREMSRETMVGQPIVAVPRRRPRLSGRPWRAQPASPTGFQWWSGLQPNATYFSENLSLRNRWGGSPGRGALWARTPSSRSFLQESRARRYRKAGQGAGCGPGGPPHQLCRTPEFRKLSAIGIEPALWRKWQDSVGTIACPTTFAHLERDDEDGQ